MAREAGGRDDQIRASMKQRGETDTAIATALEAQHRIIHNIESAGRRLLPWVWVSMLVGPGFGCWLLATFFWWRS